MDMNDQVISDHEGKATLLWEAYKDRLAKSEFQQMQADLDNLFQAATNL